MLRKTIVYIILTVVNLTAFVAQSPEEIFKLANEQYDAKSYDSAFALYQQIEDQELVSAELFQNMGTAAYKMEAVPESIYYFEKALKLDPGNDDLEHNLDLAKARITDKSDQDSSYGILGWISASIGNTADFWATFAVIFALIGGIFLSITLFQDTFKKYLRIAGIVCWILTGLTWSFAAIQNSVISQQNYAILFEPSLNVMNEPSAESSIAFVLHEGSKVEILGGNENWLKISFGKDKIGWIPRTAAKVI